MSIIIFNKKVIPADTSCINHTDRGFNLGHGLFETILVKKNAYPALDYHWKRLAASAPLLGIDLPFSYEELELMLRDLIVKNNLQEKIAGARVTITHGEAGRGILPAQSPLPSFLITVFESAAPKSNPYSALIVNTRKNEHTIASRVKTISYIDNILARKEAMAQNYDEAILLNTSSNVADGSISNIFMVKNGQILTPPVSDGALPGVVRAIILEEFSQDFSIREQTISPDEFMQADEIFLTNALMGVKSVNRLGDKLLDSFDVADKVKGLLQKRKNYI
jgi:branched-chain amino acid aminotransferase